jgi:hypothetical protein
MFIMMDCSITPIGEKVNNNQDRANQDRIKKRKNRIVFKDSVFFSAQYGQLRGKPHDAGDKHTGQDHVVTERYRSGTKIMVFIRSGV